MYSGFYFVYIAFNPLEKHDTNSTENRSSLYNGQSPVYYTIMQLRNLQCILSLPQNCAPESKISQYFKMRLITFRIVKNTYSKCEMSLNHNIPIRDVNCAIHLDGLLNLKPKYGAVTPLLSRVRLGMPWGKVHFDQGEFQVR